MSTIASAHMGSEDASCFVGGVIDDAVDDIVTELDYYSDDDDYISSSTSVTDAVHVLNAGEPVIMEADEENEDICTGTRLSEQAVDIFEDCLIDENDDIVSCCDFNSDVGSMISETPSLDDLFVAEHFARAAVSDEVIVEAFAAESDSTNDQEPELIGELSGFSVLAFDYTCGILGSALGQATSTWQQQADEKNEAECIEESQSIGAELAFDYASAFLDGALEQAASTWQKSEDDRKTSLKDKAKESMLEAARKANAAKDAQLEYLKQKARDSLLKKAAQAQANLKAASHSLDMEQLRLQVHEALSNGLQTGELARALIAAPAHEDRQPEDPRAAVKQALLKAEASGALQLTLTNLACSQAAEQNERGEASVLKVRQALSEGLHKGHFSKAMASAVQQDKWKDLQSRMRQNMSKAAVSGKLAQTLVQIMAREATAEHAQQKNNEPTIQKAMQPSDDIVQRTEEVASAPVAATPSSARSMSSSRSKRRVIGGVLRSSSAVQLRSLNDDDQPCTAKVSKTKARVLEASAMSMDLRCSPPCSKQEYSEFKSLSFSSKGFAPVTFTTTMKMGQSASLGSLTPYTTKHSAAGFLPTISDAKKTAESIAWTMQVSKTIPMWGNSGLRGSASMLF